MAGEKQEFGEVPVFTGHPGIDLVAEGKTIAKTEVAYHTAVSVQKPRDIDKIKDAILREAEFAGEEFYYQWPVQTKHGRKIVEGGSIGLAICMAREWTNCAIPVEVWGNTDHYTFRAAFVDLEKGFTLMRTFRQRKEVDIGKRYDEERKQDMIYQIGQSKAIRNVVLGAMPSWLKKEAIETAKKAVLEHITKEGIDKARNKAIDFFAGYGVEREQLIAFIGKKVNDWVTEDVELLRTTAQRLKDGDVAVDELFPPFEEKKRKKAPTAKEVLNNKGKAKSEGKPQEGPTFADELGKLRFKLGMQKYWNVLNRLSGNTWSTEEEIPKEREKEVIQALEAELPQE